MRTLVACAVVSCLGLAAVQARAQVALPFTGYELALSGTDDVVRGQPVQLRGVAYRVRGIAELVPYGGGAVRARYSSTDGDGAWMSVRADARGRFEAVAPTDPRLGSQTRFEVEVGDGDDARTFVSSVSARPPYDLMFRTDRQLYEPGEPIHVWALVRDLRSGRPRAGERASFVVQGTPVPRTERTIVTGDDGVAAFDVAVPEHAPEGYVSVILMLGEDRYEASASVGTRTYERVFTELRVEPETVAPGEAATVHVRATTTSGAAIPSARVVLTVDGQTHLEGTTEADGVAHIPITAPVYMTHSTGRITLVAEVTHPAHGTARVGGTLGLAVPLTLELTAVPRLGSGLVPEVDDVVYVCLQRGDGTPPPAGTIVEVRGAAVRGGSARAASDSNGFAEIPVRLPAGAWAPRSGGAERVTTVFARVSGPLELSSFLELGVSRADVAPRVRTPVVEPGQPIEVDVLRGPSAARADVTVELLDAQGDVVGVRRLAPGVGRARFDAPVDRLGVFGVRARAVRERESYEAEGATDHVLVRPRAPSFVELEPERVTWQVGEIAHVDLRSAPGERAFAALMVRDLAAHNGEVPFRARWLGYSLERAVLDPAMHAADALLRVAFSGFGMEYDGPPDEAGPLLDALGLPGEPAGVREVQPERDVFRDPWPLARELERRGIGDAMRALEARLEEALDADALDAITTGTGAARRFRDDLPLDGETLGGGAITASLIGALDPSCTYDAVARRVARTRLVRLLVALSRYLDPGDEATITARMAAREPADRWLPRMVALDLLTPEALADPWGGRFALVRTARPGLVIAVQAAGFELASPGPDGRAGTADDVRDPFARVVTAGTPYALASGEDALLRQFALLSAAERTLEGLTEAYARITAEMTEDELGDAVHGGVSEGVLGLGLRGTGMGGGGGHGYGRGSGASAIHVGRASVRGGGGGVGVPAGLARVLRERFPATLLFIASRELDPSGTTRFDIPLADAVTTHLVEAIVWRPDGWVWSASTRISVDREIVVEAPVPEVARAGDVISLPVRVGNRGATLRDLRVQLLGDVSLGIEDVPARGLEVAARDAGVLNLALRPTRAGEGRLRVVVSAPDGTALDAIALPLRVVLPTRRVVHTEVALAAGDGALSFELPADASPRDGAITIATDSGLFPEPADPAWTGWSMAYGVTAATPSEGFYPGDPSTLARRVTSAWGVAAIADDELDEGLRTLTAALDGATDARTRAQMLFDLGPVARDTTRRESLAEPLRALTARLRAEVADGAALLGDEPDTLLLAAAALALTSPQRDARAAELVRRAERSIVSLGDDVFVAGEASPVRASVLLALADLALGQHDRAFRLLRTLARWSSRGLILTPEECAMARVAMHRLFDRPPPESVVVEIDGETQTLLLDRGNARLEDARLAAPGAHLVRVHVEDGAPVLVRLTARYGVPWTDVTPPGPFVVALEGEVGVLDGTSELVLVLRNRTPRLLAQPTIEIDLPTGAELTPVALQQLTTWSAGRPERAGDVLTLTLTPMLPGAERRIPLRFRWSVGGTLQGLGIVAYALDRPEVQTVLPPRALELSGGVQ